MPFVKGQSGNPSGRPSRRRRWIDDRTRYLEARKTFARLIEIRDGLVLERKTMDGPDGPYQVDVVLSAKDYIACCKELMNRLLGLPRVENQIGADDHVDRAALFLEFLREWATYLRSNDPAMLEYMQVHIRNFAETVKRNDVIAALPNGDNGPDLEMK